MINSISIRNFRSIERQDFDCNWITTFVGENDAGKSNVTIAGPSPKPGSDLPPFAFANAANGTLLFSPDQ